MKKSNLLSVFFIVDVLFGCLVFIDGQKQYFVCYCCGQQPFSENQRSIAHVADGRAMYECVYVCDMQKGCMNQYVRMHLPKKFFTNNLNYQLLLDQKSSLRLHFRSRTTTTTIFQCWLFNFWLVPYLAYSNTTGSTFIIYVHALCVVCVQEAKVWCVFVQPNFKS